VLLLDEIEKAHPDLFNILLQVMDNGRLTDHHGKTVDFRNVVLIMTTNAGASTWRAGHRLWRCVQGGCGRRGGEEDVHPEFRNRLDAIVPFAYLPPKWSAAWSTSSSSSSNCNWPTRTSTSSSMTMPAPGWPEAVMTSSTAHGRWRA
jgi:MoxR-like ATPase